MNVVSGWLVLEPGGGEHSIRNKLKVVLTINGSSR